MTPTVESVEIRRNNGEMRYQCASSASGDVSRDYRQLDSLLRPPDIVRGDVPNLLVK